MSGSLVTSTATFKDVNGNVADPSTITLKYKIGSASTVTVVYPAAPITRSGTGVYLAELDTTGYAGPDPQLWATEWIGTGAVQAIAADYWQVTPPAL
jgi:hypothetical protein